MVDSYLRGTSALQVALSHGRSLHLVLDRIREAGVPVRMKGRVPTRTLQLSESALGQLQALVDGLMLGDGSIQPDGVLRLGQCRRHSAWVIEVGEILDTFGLPTRLFHQKSRASKPFIYRGKVREIPYNGGILMYTLTCEEMKAQRARWYPKGAKVIPPDVDLSPISVAQWFAGDGSGGKNGTLKFHTEGFTNEEVDFLIERLRSVAQVESARKNGVCGPCIAIYRRDDAARLRDYMGAHLPTCFSYKVKHVRVATPRGSHNKRFTDEQVREIRCRAKSETGASLAAEFGVSGTTISNIIHRKIYKGV